MIELAMWETVLLVPLGIAVWIMPSDRSYAKYSAPTAFLCMYFSWRFENSWWVAALFGIAGAVLLAYALYDRRKERSVNEEWRMQRRNIVPPQLDHKNEP